MKGDDGDKRRRQKAPHESAGLGCPCGTCEEKARQLDRTLKSIPKSASPPAKPFTVEKMRAADTFRCRRNSSATSGVVRAGGPDPRRDRRRLREGHPKRSDVAGGRARPQCRSHGTHQYLTALLSSAASPAVPPSPRRPRVLTGCGVAALGGRREEGAESGAPDGGVFAAACALGRGSSQTSPFRQLRTPTIRVGRLLRAPVRAMERLLDQTCRDFATAEPKRNGQHIMSARSSSKRVGFNAESALALRAGRLQRLLCICHSIVCTCP